MGDVIDICYIGVTYIYAFAYMHEAAQSAEVGELHAAEVRHAAEIEFFCFILEVDALRVID